MPPRRNKLTAERAKNNLDDWHSKRRPVQDWQIAIHPGMFAWANIGGGDEGGKPVTVYYQILPPPEGIAPGVDRRFACAFMAELPEGEPGSISIANFWGPLSEAEFARARVQGWPLRSNMRPTITATLRDEERAS